MRNLWCLIFFIHHFYFVLPSSLVEKLKHDFYVRSFCFDNLHKLNLFLVQAEDGMYRLGDKYDRESCFAELGSGRTEPVEFSFLTAPNSTSFQGVQDKNSYGAGMEQPFGSSYWINKHDVVQNISSRNQVTSVCVWCRSEFLHEPVHPGNQAAIGSMCPTCRTRISEQVNGL